MTKKNDTAQNDVEENIKEKDNEKEAKQEKRDEVKALKEDLEACESQYKRALADYQNLEKRSREQRIEWSKLASRDLLLRLLPVLDTLTLANKHIENQGLQVTLQQFLNVLKAEGVTKIETVGKKFDPHIMEAVDMAGDGDEVVEEVRDGYMLHDKLLRAAQVRVGKKQ